MDPSSSIFKPYQKYERCRGEKQKMLKNSIGRQIPYIVNFMKSTVQIFDIELEKTTHSFSFPDGFKLIDVDYFPTIDGQLGVILGVHDEQQLWGAENFVIALVANPEDPAMTITHSAMLPTKITVVKTLFSSKDMQEGLREQNLGLYSKLLEWNHIIAIGCKESKCFLARLNPMNHPVSVESIVIPDSKKMMLNLMNAFIKNGKLVYTHDEECYKDYPASAVSVTALALMPRSRTLLVGLSMGGILSASLNPSNNMMFLELRHERLIRELAPLEPEDDPDKFEYFIAAVDRSSRHPVMIQLWRGSFNLKAGEAVDESEKYDRPQYNACLEHKIPFGERWLAVSPIITERGLDSRRRDDSTMDSMLNVSQSYGCSYNRSHVLLAFEKRRTTSAAGDSEFVVEAAIFDIDAWYYKRVPGGVSSDGTVLRQCAFLSSIRSSIDSAHVKDIGILSLDSNDIIRFSSLVSDADQLFYPSALSFSRVFVMEGGQMRAMKIQSIQQTILEKCASRIATVIRSPEVMALDILAAGLVRKSILSGSPNSSAAEISNAELSMDQKVILNAMVYYGKMTEFCSLATRNELSDKIKMEIAEWAIHEAIDHKRTISDRTVTLFEGRGASLSPLAEGTLLQGCQLFLIVHEYLKTCANTVKEGAKYRSLAHSVKCIGNHTRLVGQFIKFGIVPPDYRVQYTMREMHEKKKATVFRNKSALPIQVVTRNMHRIAPEGQFWNDMPHEEWYPPTALDLLEAILNVNISERFKRDLIVQFVLDWLRADPSHSADTDQQLALETIRVMTNNMLNVDKEKIYYVLDEERAALKKKEAESESKAKVFSLTDDGLTYEKLWGNDVLLNATIGKSDMEKFEQRLKIQMEDGKKRRLPVLDPETEKLYQMFLFEKQKYDLMSAEAIESNDLLRSLLPGMIKKSGSNFPTQKSSREKEIEEAVRAMFEKQDQDDSQIPEVFAAIGEKGRKRRSEAYEGSENRSSPETFVPPTAKRIQLATRIQPHNETIDKTATSSIASPTDPQRNAELNMLIATPARYYRRPISVNTGMVSPPTQRPPPLPAQNSILKTAKAVQSPSRGRIRFHESVRKAINESADESRQEPEGEEAPRPKGLNFAMLDEEDEEEDVSRRRPSVKVQEHTEQEDEPIEMEKSFEQQEEFEVLEDAEDTFEPRTDDVIPNSDETFEIVESVSTEIQEEPVENVPEEFLEKSEETQEDEENDQGETENAQEEVVEKSVEVQDENEHEIIQEDKEEVPNQEQLEEKIQDDDVFAEPEAPWDGIHRSFEVQNDEDCEPAQKEDKFEDAHDDLEEEVPLTFEEQEDEPKPKGDVKETHQETTPEKPEEEKEEEVVAMEQPEQDQDRPPSANTRFATHQRAISRSTTPVEKEVVVEEQPPKKTRARTVSKSTELQEGEDDRPLSRRTRASSVKRSAHLDPVAEEEKKEEEPKVPRSRRASVRRETSVSKDPEELDETLTKKPRASSVKRTRATSEVSNASRPASRATTPSRSRAKKTVEEGDMDITPADLVLPDVSGSALVKRVSAKRNASIRAASVDTPKAPPSAQSTPRRGRPPKVKSDAEVTPAPASARSTRSASKRRTPGPDDTIAEEEPPKKARGRPRNTPLKVIPEASEEPSTSTSKNSKASETPKRGGSRSRTNSTSSTSSAVPTTPKRGKKTATLEEVVEENEDEPPTPTRRSSRRLAHQP